jgi:pimeloyl-ACP methyl ester carboxylesterase
LALRLAAAAPQLVKALVLVNPATCYNQSLSGLSSFVSATNLLGLFPQDLYNTAQVGSWHVCHNVHLLSPPSDDLMLSVPKQSCRLYLTLYQLYCYEQGG